MLIGGYHIVNSPRPGRIWMQNVIGEGGDFSRVKFEAAMGMTWRAFQEMKETPVLAEKVHKFFIENF